ncbi:MAG: glycosyltransferase, partial [Thermotogota bacterium]|nr:glycosyltransferase [Thermotogota bacterium]
HGKTGYVVPPKDSGALADAIIKLLQNDDLRKEMGENAYEKAKEELSWDSIAEKTIEVYKKVVRRK